MKFLPCFLLAFVLAQPVCAAESGSDAADALYQKAEKLEWYSRNNMREVDDLYGQAARKGSDAARMMQAYNQLALEDPEAGDFGKKAARLCGDMAAIAEKWGDEGDADQNFHLARYFALPGCDARDVVKSRALLQKAAEAGNAKAQFYMGRMLLARKNDKGAFDWFARAAEQELPQAMANQGSCYLRGLGVEKSREKGMALIDRVLENGNPNACYEIAIWYLEGEGGLPKDIDKARKILEGLAKSGYQPALLPLADLERHEEDLRKAD